MSINLWKLEIHEQNLILGWKKNVTIWYVFNDLHADCIILHINSKPVQSMKMCLLCIVKPISLEINCKKEKSSGCERCGRGVGLANLGKESGVSSPHCHREPAVAPLSPSWTSAPPPLAPIRAHGLEVLVKPALCLQWLPIAYVEYLALSKAAHSLDTQAIATPVIFFRKERKQIPGWMTH